MNVWELVKRRGKRKQPPKPKRPKPKPPKTTIHNPPDGWLHGEKMEVLSDDGEMVRVRLSLPDGTITAGIPREWITGKEMQKRLF